MVYKFSNIQIDAAHINRMKNRLHDMIEIKFFEVM